MSATGPATPAPAPIPGGARSLRFAARVVEVAWFVGVPLSLLFIFRLPFAETLLAFVVWLVVLLAIDRFASSAGAVRPPQPPEDPAP